MTETAALTKRYSYNLRSYSREPTQARCSRYRRQRAVFWDGASGTQMEGDWEPRWEATT